MEELQHMAWSIILVTIIVVCLVTIFLVLYATFRVVRDYEYEHRKKKHSGG